MIAYDTFARVMGFRAAVRNNKALGVADAKFHFERPEDLLDAAYQPGGAGESLKRIDRNLVKEILYGGLRWYSKIYWILQNTSSRNLDETSPEVRTALVLGTYQIFYMDRVPERAAVNESVEYVRSKGQANAVPFVNGILRQIARRAEYFAKPDKTRQPVDYLALQFSFPRWMVERWIRQFRADKLETMLAAMNQPPPYTIRVNTIKTPVNEAHLFQQELLRQERNHSDRCNLRGAFHCKDAPDTSPESLFSAGWYTIQDEASQLIGHLVDAKPGETVIDAACGPGGKFSHLFELSCGAARLIGVEKSESQLLRARQTMDRLGHSSRPEARIEWHHADFLEWKSPVKADKILLDAPCSGMGVIKRHPESKWQKDANLVRNMSLLQRNMIAHALRQLKTGGEMIFSVCSFEPEETTEQLAWIKKEFGDAVEVISPVVRLPDYFKRYVTRDNVLLIYGGNQDQTDGFGSFIVKVRSALPEAQ
jgi:16S rRNA (cytosine967-C5)-methyltransferase